jgi:hypothetical protein
MANPKITIEDGSVVSLATALAGGCQDPYGNAITFSQVGTTNTYTEGLTISSISKRVF